MGMEIFRNKRVLVTGHTGFKGSWLAIWLLLLGAEVIGYALDPKRGKDNFVLTRLGEKITDIRADICDYQTLKKVIQKYQPEVVFHLAAQALVGESYRNPRSTYETNVLGTVNMLEAIRENGGVKVFINITSDKCYENQELTWGYRENDPLGGFDPYSSSKSCSEIITSAYRRSFFSGNNPSTKTGIATARAGNVIGGGDWGENRLVPDIINSLEKNSPIKLRNPYSIRPWQHIFDPLYGYLILAEKLSNEPEEFSGPWNFGPEPGGLVSVQDLAKKVVELFGRGEIEEDMAPEKFPETNILQLDPSKARSKLGWQTVLDLDTALALTVDWYKNYGKADVFELCTKQIKGFMQGF